MSSRNPYRDLQTLLGALVLVALMIGLVFAAVHLENRTRPKPLPCQEQSK